MTDETSAMLERIERYSTWLVSDAETVQRVVSSLRYRPDFESKANAQMQLAKARMESALRVIDDALAGYAARPAENNKAA